jgi:hypothetical protein
MTNHNEAMTRPTTYRPECGSNSGWWAHKRASEKPCQPCRKAVAIGLRNENALSIGQAIDELRDMKNGRRRWNPNLAEPKDEQ